MQSQEALIGARIKMARKVAGLTQAELAERVGVSRSAVAQWETGRTGQVGTNLTRIAEILGVRAGDLLEGAVDEGVADSGPEQALLRLYRACSEYDQQFLLHTAVRLARLSDSDLRAAQEGE